MKQLLIMRHAKSSWDNPHLSDHDRPLNARGKRDAPRMGNWLQRQDAEPEIIISSSATRAVSTAKAIANSIGFSSSIQIERDLYHGGPEDYLDYLRTLPDTTARAMVIGHNPGMEDLVEELVGSWCRLPTAAIAVIGLSINKWKELSDETHGSLLELWLPKEIDG